MKKVVVSGASKGIGLAIAKRFAKDAGSAVVICSRNIPGLEEAVAEIKAAGPHAQVFYKTCDMGVKSQVQAFGAFAAEKLGSIDVLVNNAGIFLPGQIHREEEGTLETLVATNLYSAYWLTRALIPLMMSKRQGHIFNMCSTASIMPYVNGGSYGITKHALLGMNNVLREEMKAYDIKVTAVLPGATLTDSWAGTDLPESRFMKAEDVAELVYLISNLSPSAVVEQILLRPLAGDIS